MSLSAGDRFDRYVIEELLGEGGMAQVYRATDPRLHRRVALKILKASSTAEPDLVIDAPARALREARAAAALDHPNAVSVFDVGEYEGELYISMELVNGKSLRPYVHDPTIAWETKLRWMVDAARALGAAHERGLVHRDVKPENIMVRHDGVVKVLDFGIAKRTRIETPGWGTLDDARSQSLAGGILGTPWYLSPEQLRGDVVDGRADQFAWAVTTYELLTGTLPWPKGVDGFQLVLAILNKTPDALSIALPHLPSIVDATILKALAKAPAQRFEAMEYVVSALEGLSSPSRRSWADVPAAAMTKTDPAPALAPASSGPTLPTPEGGTTLTSPTARAPVSLALPAVVAAGAMALATVVGLVSARLVRPALAEGAQIVLPIPSASTSAAPLPITAAPPPRTNVPEALAAYRTFQQSFRDADWSSAVHALETAVERDPDMAAAHLRLAFMRSEEAYEEGQVRSSFHAAVRNRTRLDERDTALLDALEPYLQREPSDPVEAEKRLAELRTRWPDDAEIAYVQGSVAYDRGDLAFALAAFDAATRIDPGFAQALSSKGGCLAYMGQLDDARHALDAALKLSPTATEALWYEAEMAEQEGRCAEQESLAHAWLARDPDDSFAYQWMAGALASEGKPLDTVRTALEQKWVRLDTEHRAKRQGVDRGNLAMLDGDFTAAEASLRDLETVMAGEPGAQAHAEAQWTLLRIAEETGHDDRARAIASSYLARKDAWTTPHRVDDVSIILDPLPSMLGALTRAGAMSAADRDAQRGQWVDTWRAKTAASYLGHLWMIAWAMPARTRDDAVAALEALPRMGGPPPFAPTTLADAQLGHVYLLAGRAAEAVAPLRRGAATCTVLGEPILNTRAWRDYGQALEATGDHDGACAAYGVVLSRWGHARPRSVTAEDARTRARALGCH